jgi:hypothetical protein
MLDNLSRIAHSSLRMLSRDTVPADGQELVNLIASSFKDLETYGSVTKSILFPNLVSKIESNSLLVKAHWFLGGPRRPKTFRARNA